jgi:UDPglucose--hexose-1-phosphate uridylyltransferase
VLLAPYASRLPYQLMLVPRRPRARFEDDGPRAPRCCTTALGRLRASLGRPPPLNLWVRTAPRGRRALLLADRRHAAAHAPRRPRARHGRAPQHRRPEQAAAELRDA